MRKNTSLVTAAGAAVVLMMTSCSAGSLTGGGSSEKGGKALTLGGEKVASQKLWDSALEEGSVNVYTSINEVATNAMQKAFTKDTGVEVTGVRTPTGRLNERILSEHGAKTLPADVIAMPDDTLWQNLVDKGLFTAHKVPNDAAIPEEYKAPDSLYYSITSAPTTLAYNTEVLKKYGVAEPTKWSDLLDPGLKGERLGIAHASQGAGGWTLALFMRKKFGKDYWRELAAQQPVLASSVGSLGERLGRGEVAVAAARPSIVGDLQEQGAPVKMIWPEDGIPMFNFYIAQVAGSKHSSAAQLYINWAMSERGQKIASKRGSDYGVIENAALPEVNGKPLPKMSELDPFFATDAARKLREPWIAEWNDVFGYRG